MKSNKSTLSYFTSSFVVTIVGLLLSFGIGYYYSGTVSGGLTTVFITFILSVLELSLSFDNAVVNATVLKKMSPVWQHRFLTWGMLIAVFGMRLVFPVVIVSVVGDIGPIDALIMAATSPDEYAALMMSSHIVLAAFGGAFLLLVALKYFFDEEKDIHWIRFIERPLVRLGKAQAFEVALTLLALYGVSTFLETQDQFPFMLSGVLGVVTFILVDSISAFLEAPKEVTMDIHKASFGMFMYLEVLDASFSFDGVIGAFAITHNLFVIAIGLGIGAMFVRSLTIYLVEQGTLSKFRYLEHGAFYAIGALAILMFVGTRYHVNEAITGLIGAGFIGVAFWASIQHNRQKN